MQKDDFSFLKRKNIKIKRFILIALEKQTIINNFFSYKYNLMFKLILLFFINIKGSKLIVRKRNFLK